MWMPSPGKFNNIDIWVTQTKINLGTSAMQQIRNNYRPQSSSMLEPHLSKKKFHQTVSADWDIPSSKAKMCTVTNKLLVFFFQRQPIALTKTDAERSLILIG